jgi:hypothetical protein
MWLVIRTLAESFLSNTGLKAREILFEMVSFGKLTLRVSIHAKEPKTSKPATVINTSHFFKKTRGPNMQINRA